MKIGHTADWHKRRTNVYTSCPVTLILHALFEGDTTREAELHRIFLPHHKHGEWFAVAPCLAWLVQNELAQSPVPLPKPVSRREAIRIAHAALSPEQHRAAGLRLNAHLGGAHRIKGGQAAQAKRTFEVRSQASKKAWAKIGPERRAEVGQRLAQSRWKKSA